MSIKVIIRVFSHGISAKPVDAHAKHALREFSKTTAEWEYKKLPPTWRSQRVMSRVFCGCTNTRSDFRFHKTQLDELIKHLQYNNINKDCLSITHEPLSSAVTITMGMTLPDPYDYQIPGIEHCTRADLPIKVMHLQTGKGKAQSLKSRIKVPGGWMKMGDMTIGQEIITPSGEVAKVDGVFPQGMKQLYTVTFADGRQTKACAEHLWKIKENDNNTWSILNTLELLSLLNESGKNVFIPLVSDLSQHDTTENPFEDSLNSVKHSFFDFCLAFTNKERAENFQYMVRQKGGSAKLTSIGSKHTVSISFNQSCLQLLSIVPDTVELAQCISIDHPEHLYVTDDFIVTHNTLSALHIINKLNVRTIIQLRGGYVGRWVPDILKAFNITAKKHNNELLVCRGSKDLFNLIQSAKAGLIDKNNKVIVITNGTLHAFLKEYEDNPLDNYFGIEPQELYPLLGIGFGVVDEAHEDYHLIYRSTIYSHLNSRLYLSATLDTQDSFRKQIYRIMYPDEAYAPAVKYDAYIDVCAVHYNIRPVKAFRLKHRAQENYSHQAFEEGLLLVPGAFDNYMEIIKQRLGIRYFDRYQPGHKALLFFRLTAVCDLVLERLKALYTDMDINVFYSGVDEKVLETSDIIVSTIESCGTARDIPNLAYAMLTRAVKKLETNEQIKGRLRVLKRYNNLDPFFDYFVCDDIDKHVQYHKEKKEQFKNKAKAHYDAFTRIIV